jgi:hypothetical protein
MIVSEPITPDIKLATVCDPAMDTPTMPRSSGEPTHEQPSSLKIRFDASKAGTG